MASFYEKLKLVLFITYIILSIRQIHSAKVLFGHLEVSIFIKTKNIQKIPLYQTTLGLKGIFDRPFTLFLPRDASTCKFAPKHVIHITSSIINIHKPLFSREMSGLSN